MFKKDIGAQILLYSAYVAAVFMIQSILFAIARGFVMQGIIHLIILGFLFWVMYTVANEYMAKKEFTQWKAWVVLVISVYDIFLFLIGNLDIFSLILNVVVLFGAVALLFGIEDTEVV